MPQCDNLLESFHHYTQVREALRQQILLAIDSIYYHVLEDETFGYADVTVLALLTHLETTYATLSADDLARIESEIEKHQQAIAELELERNRVMFTSYLSRLKKEYELRRQETMTLKPTLSVFL